MSRKRSKSESCRAPFAALCLFTLLIVFMCSTSIVSAYNDWQSDNLAKRKSYIPKPVDPVFINVDGNPVYREKNSIGIDLGETWDLQYFLEGEKRYHIFLVGDWISNDTDPETDYDILTIYPDGTDRWNTESAGLPEQVAFDARHQYFEPPETGTYTFQIINDIRDSDNTEAAIFMLIEHIELNADYSRYLEGREYDHATQRYEEIEFTSWAYEFNTPAPRIRIFVDVPDMVNEPERGDLDMYEVRLYVMANPNEEVGYLIDGIGVPSGGLFNNFRGEYGGFDTSCYGDRNIEAFASCEYPGADMEFTYETPNVDSNSSDIFYYLVLIAEHGMGTVEFYVQTDFAPPEIALVEPIEGGYAGEQTEIKVHIDDDSEIGRVWVEYTDHDGDVTGEYDLSSKDSIWTGDFPPFSGGDNVTYTVYAEDRFGNTGSVESWFLVKEETTIRCSAADLILSGDEKAEISGTTSLTSAPLTLLFTNGATNHDYEVTTDEEGGFDFVFTPDKIGEWVFQAFFDGTDIEYPAASNAVAFTMKSKPTHISNILMSSRVKLNEPVIVSGSVTPGMAGLPVEVMFVSSSSSHTETVVTTADGSYSVSFVPKDVGVWSVLSSVGDGLRYASSQSELVECVIVPLNALDKVVIVALNLVTPPTLYWTGGLTGLVASALIYLKRDRIIPLLPKSLVAKMGLGKKRGKSGNKKSVQRYRRVKKT